MHLLRMKLAGDSADTDARLGRPVPKSELEPINRKNLLKILLETNLENKEVEKILFQIYGAGKLLPKWVADKFKEAKSIKAGFPLGFSEGDENKSWAQLSRPQKDTIGPAFGGEHGWDGLSTEDRKEMLKSFEIGLREEAAVALHGTDAQRGVF